METTPPLPQFATPTDANNYLFSGSGANLIALCDLAQEITPLRESEPYINIATKKSHAYKKETYVSNDKSELDEFFALSPVAEPAPRFVAASDGRTARISFAGRVRHVEENIKEALGHWRASDFTDMARAHEYFDTILATSERLAAYLTQTPTDARERFETWEPRYRDYDADEAEQRKALADFQQSENSLLWLSGRLDGMKNAILKTPFVGNTSALIGIPPANDEPRKNSKNPPARPFANFTDKLQNGFTKEDLDGLLMHVNFMDSNEETLRFTKYLMHHVIDALVKAECFERGNVELDQKALSRYLGLPETRVTVEHGRSKKSVRSKADAYLSELKETRKNNG